MLIHMIATWQTNKKDPSLFWQRIINREKVRTEFRLSLVQISVALDETNGGEIFRMCTSVKIDIHAIEMTYLEGVNLVALQPSCSQMFNENNVITKHEIVHRFNSLCFTVLHYYNQRHVAVTQCTTLMLHSLLK